MMVLPFPASSLLDLYKTELNLIPTGLHEKGIQKLFRKSTDVLKKNLAGPKLYIKFYDPYLWLLDGTAEKQLADFMAKEPNFKVLSSTLKFILHSFLKV